MEEYKIKLVCQFLYLLYYIASEFTSANIIFNIHWKTIFTLIFASGQYSVLIKMLIVTGNEKLCEIYFINPFFQNVFALIDLFYGYHYILYFIYSNCMLRHVCTICTEAANRGVL